MFDHKMLSDSVLMGAIEQRTIEVAHETLKIVIERLGRNNCTHPSHRVEPQDANDWEAIANFHRKVVMNFAASSQRLLAQVKTAIDTLEANKTKDIAQTLAQGVKAVEDAVNEGGVYLALESILEAHDELCEHGALRTRNADIHYERIQGVAEGIIARRANGGKVGKSDRSSSRAGCRDSATGSADQKAEEAAKQT
jgi:hypothetical protein